MKRCTRQVSAFPLPDLQLSRYCQYIHLDIDLYLNTLSSREQIELEDKAKIQKDLQGRLFKVGEVRIS